MVSSSYGYTNLEINFNYMLLLALFVGFGSTGAFSAYTVPIQNNLPEERLTIITTSLQFSRVFGISLGSSLLGVILLLNMNTYDYDSPRKEIYDPDNIASVEKIKEVIEAAKQNNIPIRVGVNAGSLEKQILEKYKSPTAQALFESAKLNIQLLEDQNFDNFKISVKASNIFTSVEAYQLLSNYCNYPLHLGITEAGSYFSGSIKSSIGLGMLLYQGIGDTIRVSLSDHPTQEVKVGFEMLKSLNLRDYGVTIISCPSCARQQFDVIKTVKSVESRLSHIKKPITVSIIGCVVNGPGEATMTNIGITGGGNDTHMVYVDGEKSHRIQNEDLVEYLVKTIENKVEEIHN